MATGAGDGQRRAPRPALAAKLLELAADTISVLDADGTIVYTSGDASSVLGYGRLEGTSLLELIHPDDLHVFADVRERTLTQPGVEIDTEARLRHVDGDWQVIEATVCNLLDDPEVGGILITSRNVSRRHHHDRLLADSAAVLEAIAAHRPLADVVELVLTLLDHQERGSVALPHDPDELLAALEGDTAPERAQARRLLQLACNSLATADELRRRASADELTGLANRATFSEAVAEQLRSHAPSAVLLFDLDRFKQINDAYGHGTGDAVLVAVAEAVRRVIRVGDVAARFGGDEFAVLCRDLDDEPELAAVRVGQRIVYALATSLGPTGVPVRTGASVGVSLNGLDGVRWDDAEAWIADADHAMYEAKRRGRGRVVVADDETRTRAGVRSRIERGLRVALEQGGLEVWFQPIVELGGRSTIGAEGLLRWRAPNGAIHGPSEFLPVAEESGLMGAISLRTLAASLEQANRWATHPGGEGLVVSVNMSITQLLAEDVVTVMGGLLDSCGVDPDRLMVELNERVLVADEDLVIARLRELQGLGVRLALDDFGTGWTPLRLVRSLPFDLIKVDPTLTSGVGEDDSATEFTARVVELGRSMGRRIAAEGIEREEQCRELTAMGCELGQGWLFSPPVPPEEFLAGRMGPAGGAVGP